jgi:hypothetical protein
MEKLVKEEKLISTFRSLEEDEQKEILDFILFLKSKDRQKRGWDDIIGVTEFESDASINHDKYLGETI